MRTYGGGLLRHAVFAAGIAMCAEAQGRTSVLVGAAPFLTRDRGWNFHNNLAASVAVQQLGNRVGIRVMTTLRLSQRWGIGYDTGLPRGPESAENGVTFAMHVRTAPTIGGLYAFAGPEWYQVAFEFGQLPPSGGTWVRAGGLGIERGRWAVEGKYGAFTRTLGTTRGHLDVGVLRRF